MLLFVEERINTTIERCGSVISVNDFLASPDKMDIFDAMTCSNRLSRTTSDWNICTRIRNMPKEYWQMPIHAYPAQAILSTTWLPMTL